jgi:4-diphosphocytidyl-2-C-methyl-D-erythritol kinase
MIEAGSAGGRAPLRLRAHAKVNLGLAVLGRREDGFHDLDTLFARVELHDELTIEPAERVSASLEPGADDPSLHGLRMDEDNLVLRAARSYLRVAGQTGGVSIRLLKRIPVAAGLGGGSADAAAVLRGLARLLPAQVDTPTLAKDLGSDVPFFLADLRAARGRGRGELLEPVEVPCLPLVLANPHIAVSAAEAYARLTSFDADPDRVIGPGGLDPAATISRLTSGADPGYLNSLQAGVVSAYPEIGEVLDELEGAGLNGVLMSGSGPTCFGFAATVAEAWAAARQVSVRRPGWWVWAGSLA